MDTRENKYRENKPMSRLTKNESLYKEINDSKLDTFNVHSNATVIGNQDQDIDIEKIKKILDKRYNEMPKRKSIRIDQVEEPQISDEPTKEYDLNVVLEKAREEKEESYEEERAKKLRNTQFDILNNLNIKEEEPETKSAEDDLLDLINTITINESKKKEEDIDPLSILGEDVEEDSEEPIIDNLKKAEEVIKENKESIDNSFYTTNVFKKKDFEDESNEFVDDDKMGIGLKLLIVLIVIVFLVGIFLFLKSFLNF